MNIQIIGQGQSIGEEKSGDFPVKLIRRMPFYARIGLLAATKALKNANLFPAPPDMGLVVGTRYGCQEASLDFMDSIIEHGPELALPMAFANSVNNMAAGLIASVLGVQGPSFTVNTEGQSFIGALQTSFVLLNGRVRYCLTGHIEEADPRLAALVNIDVTPLAYFLVLSAEPR